MCGSDLVATTKYDGHRMHARIGEVGLCRWRAMRALDADGVPVFSRLRAAMDEGRTDELVFFAFDLLFLTGKSAARLPLIQRGDRLQRRFKQQ
jgi:hypothetical protein